MPFTFKENSIQDPAVAEALKELQLYLGDYDENLFSRWDDLRFPASVINLPGQVSDPDFDTVNGGWLFAAAGTELVFLMAQLPHAWEVESPIVPHVHWQKTTSATGDVYWQLEYKWASIAEVMDVAFTTLFSFTTVTGTPDNDTANEHLITSFGNVSTVDRGISDMLVMKLSRIGGNGSDTYGADARLLEFDIHIMSDSFGSNAQFEKSR